MWAFQTKEHFKLLLIIVLLCSWPQFASTLHVYAKQLRKTSHSNRRSSKSLVESKLETRKHFRLLSNEDDSNKVENISPKSPLSVAVEARTLTSNKEIDKNIIKLLLPATLNFAIVPLVGAADTFWVGRMHNALALAGQGAANQIFNSAFFIFSFLPNVITPLIAKAHGSDDKEGVKSRVAEALFICMVVGIIGTGLLSGFSER
ncbi:hypothetical protein EON65_24440 [archaeon]|nr:MAG: hypothetical protein EON65_24440 [archaeon]